jgi:hypothetical protein
MTSDAGAAGRARPDRDGIGTRRRNRIVDAGKWSYGSCGQTPSPIVP